jgi:hypothetical protein
MTNQEFLDKLRSIVVDYDKTYGNWPESKFEGLAFYQYALYHCDIEDDSEILENKYPEIYKDTNYGH